MYYVRDWSYIKTMLLLIFHQVFYMRSLSMMTSVGCLLREEEVDFVLATGVLLHQDNL